MIPQINISPEEWNVIEAYLDEKEDSQKTIQLQEAVEKIPDFHEKLEYVKKIREEIEDSIRMFKIKGFHADVSEIEKTDFWKSGTRRLRSIVFLYSIAAAIIVLFGIFWVFNYKTPAEKIFANNFKPDIGLPLKMGTAKTYSFYEGMVDYKQENYKDAIAKWEILLKKTPENDTLNYFLGIANLALGKPNESLVYLQNQAVFTGGMFAQDATYYAALAKIKNGDFEAARILLKNNPSPNNTKLLKELENR